MAATAAALARIEPAAGTELLTASPDDRQPSDDLAQSVAAPLQNGPAPQNGGKKSSDSVSVIPGLVNQVVAPRPLDRGRGVPGLDGDAPAWGNDAYWNLQ
jgi:hypothetical protein